MGFSVIHLSDIHIKGEDDVILKRTDELYKACNSAIVDNSNVVIAVTGDIAFSGKETQYNCAENLFRGLELYLQSQAAKSVQFVFAPGNHDCNFDVQESIRKVLVDSAKPDIIDESYFKNVVKIQDNYYDFIKKFDLVDEGIFTTKEFVFDGKKILFSMLNTAWMSVLRESPGKLIMPTKLFGKIEPSEYNAVFYLLHHPINWLNPDYKNDFVNDIRKNADVVLLGHEHTKDDYEKIGDNFSVYCNHGKELQDSNSERSAFSVFNFDATLQNYNIVDFEWKNDKYVRLNEKVNQFHKNIASQQTVFNPNQSTVDYIYDLGFTANHFSKDCVMLPDLFVWPDLKKFDYNNDKRKVEHIRTDTINELYTNDLCIFTGSSSHGKTSMAKMLYLDAVGKGTCCVLVDGEKFTSSDITNIEDTINEHFIEQYNRESLEDFRQLPREKKIVIIDNFDSIKAVKNRRNLVVDYLTKKFHKVVIFLTSSIDITSILSSETIDSTSELFYYDILPLGNRKRKELISKWYHLNEENLTEEEISEKIEKSVSQIDSLLGNGAAFIPALPIFIINVLQNNDAIKPTYGNSKYAVLYESLILSTLSKISSDYITSGASNIDINMLSKLAFSMLIKKHTNFIEPELEAIVKDFCDDVIINISYQDFLKKMVSAQIIYKDSSEGETYRFKYPYMFYYFAGRYIAYNLKNKDVKDAVIYMSSKLFNETYGNIIIFVCHFSNNQEIIDEILLNAYETLSWYEPFDFTKSNPIFKEIQETVEALIPATVGGNESVNANKNKVLERMDEVGINDGQVTKGESEINDNINETEKEMASVSAAFKTLEVLGQILQNYPGDINGENKISIIDEVHKLGMRSVQAIINTMGYLERDLVEYIIDKAKSKKQNIRRDEVVSSTKRFINFLISGTVRGMVHQVAISLNSKYILEAATRVFSNDNSISSKLILVDLKLNCLNMPNYQEIANLKKIFDSQNERFASSILCSIVGYYLTYNKCDRALRSKLCALCGISEKQIFIENKKELPD